MLKMGYDAYWPTSIAAITVACLPAAAIDPLEFEKIKTALADVNELRNAEIDSVDEVEHGTCSE